MPVSRRSPQSEPDRLDDVSCFSSSGAPQTTGQDWKTLLRPCGHTCLPWRSGRTWRLIHTSGGWDKIPSGEVPNYPLQILDEKSSLGLVDCASPWDGHIRPLVRNLAVKE